MGKPLRLLLVEDSPDDAELILHELARAGYDVVHHRVQTAGDMRAALADKKWDVVISDYVMPEFSAPEALKVLRASGIDLPFLIVSGTIGEEIAVEALKAGADDYLVKGRFARLIPAIERGMREVEVRSQQRLAEAALQESEAKYRRIVETAHEGIWVIDGDHRTVYMNRRMGEMLGAAPHELLGASMLDFIDEEARANALRSLDPQPTGPEQLELKFRRSNGRDFWATLSISVIADEAGKPIGALAMVMDVTEQRKLQAQLMMSDRLVSVGTLAAGVAHEINNPLASVIANLEMVMPSLAGLTREVGDSPQLCDMREQLSDASEAARRVQNIVRDLKVFSRTQEETYGPVDVRVVLDSVVRLAWNEIRHRARLVKNYGAVLPVMANESRLGQVFLNLLINAAQAIPEGQADRNEIRLSALPASGGRVVVEIRDTGLGMSPEVLNRLFTPFFTTKPVGIGTGLGLSICHRIVHSIGGEISVESELGKGSAFRVSMPADSSSRAAAPAPRPPPTAVASRRGRVLVVDDEPMMVKVVQRMLTQDHDVVTATVAREALDLLSAGQRFDVILCDLMMPHITGMDFYMELQRIDRGQARRVIFLTGGAFTPRMRAFLDEVENLRLEKPFEPASLRAIVNGRVANT
jgi:PAS domain S-box-containing protein